jgi:hypothetical protein
MQMNELAVFKACAPAPKYLYSLESSQVARTLYKVWSGFTKFIRSQLSQGRSVNSTDFGRFIQTEGVVKFIPNEKFLQKGNFVYKNQADVRAQEVKDRSKDQHVSYSAIAYACEVDRDLVSSALKEITGKAIDLISQGKVVVLNVKVGTMTLSSGQLEFRSGAPQGLNTSVDAVRTQSVPSSVRTPRSSRCTIFRPDTSQSNVYHASNPNPMHQGASPNVNNYQRGLKVKRGSEPPVPFPFFAGMAAPNVHFQTKYTRRQAIDVPVSATELLYTHKEQIRAKKEGELEARRKAKEEERKRLMDLHFQIVKDRDTKIEAERKKRVLFVEGIQEHLDIRTKQQTMDSEVKANETYDYFPFTHGDQIEKFQQELKQKEAQEMKAAMQSLPKLNRSSQDLPYASEYPVFLQQAEFHPVRRIEQSHVHNVMKDALHRYEQQLVTIEKEQDRREDEKRKQDQHNQLYYETMLQQRQQKTEEMKQFLEMQIEERVRNR